MSEFSGMSKDDFEPLVESYNKSIYIDEEDNKKNEVKPPANTRETSEKSKIPPKNTKK